MICNQKKQKQKTLKKNIKKYKTNKKNKKNTKSGSISHAQLLDLAFGFHKSQLTSNISESFNNSQFLRAYVLQKGSYWMSASWITSK